MEKLYIHIGSECGLTAWQGTILLLNEKKDFFLMFYYLDKSQTINFCTLGGNEALKWLSVIGGIGQSVKLKLNTYLASQNESFKI